MSVAKIRVRDGAQLAYEVRGRTTHAAPLVLIHSLAMDHTFWDAVTPALSEATAVLTYDCRGHGQSDKPDGPYRVEQFADDLADLLDHLNWRSAIVAGASMGGCITLAFAAAYPKRAAALGLFDTAAWYNAPDKWEERAATADLTAALPRLKMPVRIVVGEEDYATPVAMAETLNRGIAGSTLAVIPNARHLTPLECPERIVAELQKLLEMAPAQ